jgi:hypothetical protein
MTDLDWLDEAIHGREVRGLDARDLKEYRRAMLERALLENDRECAAAAAAWRGSLDRLAEDLRKFSETVLSIPGLAEAVTDLEVRAAVERELATRTDWTLPEP